MKQTRKRPRVGQPAERRHRKMRARGVRWTPDIVIIAEAMAYVGASDLDIVGYLGCNEKTFREWKKRHPELGTALARGRRATADVSRALFQRATGFVVQDRTRKVRVIKDDAGMITGRIEEETVVDRHVLPDPKSAIFWLMQRDPERWAQVTGVVSDALDHGRLVQQLEDSRERMAEFDRKG